jgi:hypothetical protein
MALRTAVALALYCTEGSETASEDHLQKARVIAQETGDTHQLNYVAMRVGFTPPATATLIQTIC